jgi:hypothetical protein
MRIVQTVEFGHVHEGFQKIERLTDFDQGRSRSQHSRVKEFAEYTARMIFTKRLREGVRSGKITCSVRIWTRPHVTAGTRYRMDEGHIEVDSIEPIGLPDVTPELARESGFLGVLDLLKTAKHGKGDNIYLVRFHYIPPAGSSPRSRVRKLPS